MNQNNENIEIPICTITCGGKGLTAVSTATLIRFPATADLTFGPQRHILVSWA